MDLLNGLVGLGEVMPLPGAGEAVKGVCLNRSTFPPRTVHSKSQSTKHNTTISVKISAETGPAKITTLCTMFKVFWCVCLGECRCACACAYVCVCQRERERES